MTFDNAFPRDSGVNVVDCTMAHVGQLADNLRAGDREEIEAQGLGPRAVIRRSLRGSLWARTYLIDGRVAAIIGMGGVAIGNVGLPWLLTSPVVERVSPRTFAEQARWGVEVMLSLKPHLENYVLASYTKAIRLLKHLGFSFDDPKPYGPRGVAFRRFYMDR